MTYNQKRVPLYYIGPRYNTGSKCHVVQLLLRWQVQVCLLIIHELCIFVFVPKNKLFYKAANSNYEKTLKTVLVTYVSSLAG